MFFLYVFVHVEVQHQSVSVSVETGLRCRVLKILGQKQEQWAILVWATRNPSDMAGTEKKTRQTHKDKRRSGLFVHRGGTIKKCTQEVKLKTLTTENKTGSTDNGHQDLLHPPCCRIYCLTLKQARWWIPFR